MVGETFSGREGEDVANKLGGSDVQVMLFPDTDDVLAEHVRELLIDAGDADRSGVAEVLRNGLEAVYPNVSVRAQSSLAALGAPVVYVYRDGGLRHGVDATDWAESPDCARVVTDEGGTYIEANDTAADLFGVPADKIVGARAGNFTEPDARIKDGAELWRRLQESGRLHSFAVVRKLDGTRIPVEFLTVVDGDGPGRTTTYLRETT